MKTVPVDLKKFSDLVDKDVVKKSFYQTKLNKLIILPIASTLIHINDYNADEQNWEIQIEDVDENTNKGCWY